MEAHLRVEKVCVAVCFSLIDLSQPCSVAGRMRVNRVIVIECSVCFVVLLNRV